MSHAFVPVKDKKHVVLHELPKGLLQILGGSLLIALLAQIQIPLFFTPVPLTLGTLAIMLVAGFMGRVKGTLTVIAYLAEISIGLPFAAGGAAPLALIGPTGGYLMGYILQAYLVGWVAENKRAFSAFGLLALLSLVSLAVLAMGAAWLGYFVGWNQVMPLGVYPFLPGDFLKTLIATLFISRFSRLS